MVYGDPRSEWVFWMNQPSSQCRTPAGTYLGVGFSTLLFGLGRRLECLDGGFQGRVFEGMSLKGKVPFVEVLLKRLDLFEHFWLILSLRFIEIPLL